jgi:hypothetical protein
MFAGSIKLKDFKIMKKEPIKGYKVTDENMQCLSFKYELGKKFKHNGAISICNYGFHYCPVLADCFGYYTFASTNRVFEILDHGTPINKGDKSCTDEIEFIKELTWLEVLTIVNIGKDNTGLKNTGNSNTGYRNTGNWNTGDSNTGNWNTGDRNTGYSNTGNSNTGYRNTGNWNTGNWNAGYRNTGNCNTGYSNTGDSNTGYRNTGYMNTGNWNTGDRNTGDSNTGYRNTGAFCTDNDPKMILFNKETTMTVREWERSKAFDIMASYLDINIWIPDYKMTDAEKESYPSYKTTEGFLKPIPAKEAWLNMWCNLSDDYKKVFTQLENFDKDIFKEITDIDV